MNKTNKKEFIVAVDGPAGSGKSTISKIIAKENDFTYLDTGAMYRIVTYYFIKNNINFSDIVEVENALDKIIISLDNHSFLLNGQDVSTEIRSEEVTSNVSAVAAIPEVREKLVDSQRELVKNNYSILDGRDIGTVVFPMADLKVYLDATPEERASRRYKEQTEKGISQSYDEVLESIIKRDHLDSTREISPLRKASDAIAIDTTGKDIDAIVKDINKFIRELLK